MLTSLINLLDSVILLYRNNCISQPTAIVFIENLHTAHTSPLVLVISIDCVSNVATENTY